MTDLHIIFKNKIDTISSFENKLIALNNKAKANLDENLIKKLPEFSGEISESNIAQHLIELENAIKNPIIHKRKKDIESLGISISTMNDIVFENDLIERIFSEFTEIRNINERVFKYFISAFSSDIINADEFIEKLSGNKKILKELTILENIKSNNLKDILLKKFFSELIDLQELKSVAEKIENIEKEYSIQITTDNQIQKLDNILSNKKKIADFGVQFTEKYTSINDLENALKEEVSKAEDLYNTLSYSFKYFKNFTSKYYTDTKNLKELVSNIDEIKNSLKKTESEIIDYIEKLYIHRFQITDYKKTYLNLKIVANQIEIIDLSDKSSINTINEIANNINQLNSLKLNKKKDTKFKSETEFTKYYQSSIKSFLQKKQKLNNFQKLTKEQEIEITDNEQLTNLLNNTEKKLQTELGKEYKRIIEFLNNEDQEIPNVDIDTLKKFIKYVKPILKDALNYD